MDPFRTRGIVAATLSLSAIAAAALVMFPVDHASASPAQPTAAALGFNIFAEGDASLTSNEADGPVALGGDLTIGGNFQVGGNSSGTFIAPGDSVPSALVIGGAVDFAASGQFRLQVQAGAYAKVGNLTNADVLNTDANNASVNTRIVADGAPYESMPRVELTTQQPIPSVGPTTPIDFATAFADFRSSSTTLAGCANTITLNDAQGDPLTFPLPPGTNAFVTLASGMTNVLNITAADLNNVAILTFQTPPSSNAPLLINVDTGGVGNIFNWTVPNQAGIGGTSAPFMLWNFPTATAIMQTPASASLEGTLYAPNADLIDLSASNNEGQVIVASIVMGTANANGGETHSFPFTATLNCGGLPTTGIVTDASDNVVLGGSVTDTATLAGGQNPTGSITFNLYGPGDTNCTGAAVFTSQVTVNGNNSYTSQSFMPTQPGVYRWIAAYSGDANNAPATTACNDPNESVIVTAPNTPTIVTNASDDVVLGGGSVNDTATLASGQNPTGSITFNLYGPNDTNCSGTAVFTSVITVNGNGDYTSQSFVPTQAGVYRWIAAYSGDANNAPAATLCNDPDEAVTVTAPNTPTIVTDASDDVVLGGPVSDTATLTGFQNPTGSITFNLYGPNDTDCTGAAVFTSQITVNGNASYTSQEFVPTQAGVYRWIAAYSGDANNAPATTLCNDPNEAVTVTAATTTPTLVTNASADTYVGGTVYDTATLSGGNQPTGTITFDLYGPDDATCAGPPVFTSTVDVTGNSDYQSAAFSPSAPGSYRWIASYSGDANNAAVSTSCDDPAEQVTVEQKKKKKPHGYRDNFLPWLGSHFFDHLKLPWHIYPEPPYGG